MQRSEQSQITDQKLSPREAAEQLLRTLQTIEGSSVSEPRNKLVDFLANNPSEKKIEVYFQALREEITSKNSVSKWWTNTFSKTGRQFQQTLQDFFYTTALATNTVPIELWGLIFSYLTFIETCDGLRHKKFYA